MIIAFFLILLFIFPILFALAIKLSRGKNLGRTLLYMICIGMSCFLFVLGEPAPALFFLVLPILVILFIKMIGWSLKVLIK